LRCRQNLRKHKEEELFQDCRGSPEASGFFPQPLRRAGGQIYHQNYAQRFVLIRISGKNCALQFLE
jgi:hypothetical protein